MKENFFNILLMDGENINKDLVDTNSLYKIIDEFINSDNSMISIFKVPEKLIKKEIEKYYISQYSCLYRKHKTNKITEKQYKEALNILKKSRNESNTVKQFKEIYEKYKKNTNNIPPYSVSD